MTTTEREDETAELVAQRLHDETCRGCDLPLTEGWLDYGREVVAGHLTYERAAQALGRGPYSARGGPE
jgi:hypothetical protein